jgi:regulator of protease activity HflC (stomatin/prohibitin superfamily)
VSDSNLWLSLGIPIVVVLGLILSAFRVLREYERGVIFLLGRFYQVKGPGLIVVVPFIQQMVRVDLRVVVFDVPPQDVISRDNVSVKVNAVLYFRVVDPQKTIINVADFFFCDQPVGADHSALGAGTARAR